VGSAVHIRLTPINAHDHREAPVPLTPHNCLTAIMGRRRDAFLTSRWGLASRRDAFLTSRWGLKVGPGIEVGPSGGLRDDDAWVVGYS
jgi:hypothetical protein